MKARPMLFSPPMVRALRRGAKTQTRRIMKHQPSEYVPSPNRHPTRRTEPYFDAYNGGPYWCWWSPDNRQGPDWIKCPYGVPGDQLWVKETWRPVAALNPWDLEVIYAADGQHRLIRDGEFGERDWTMPKAAATGNVSPLFMPQWASRITLDITQIRAERLQDISETDAIAEGLQWVAPGKWAFDPSLPIISDDPRQAYRELWEHLNGRKSWDANPWVWVADFPPQEPAHVE